MLTLDRPHRPQIVGVATLGLLVAVGPIDRLRHRIVASRHRFALLYAWSGLSYAFVGLASYLDGGPRSPTVLIVIVTLGYATIAYPPRVVVVFSAAAVATYGAVAWASNGPQNGPDVLFEACIIVLVGALCSLAAGNQWRSRHDLIDMADRLAQLAMTDHVTGCLNRRALWERLTDEILRADRDGSVLTLIMIDIDRFKIINDTYGHLAGDRVLDEVGGALLEHVRGNEIVGRIGGDEFAVVLPDTPATAARRLAERVLEAVHTLELSIPIPVTVSVGLAEYPAQASQIEALFEAADRSLYGVKAAGSRRGRTGRDHLSARQSLTVSCLWMVHESIRSPWWLRFSPRS